MLNKVDYHLAKSIMKDNFVGFEELRTVKELDLLVPLESIPIPYSEIELEKKRKDYFLIYGCSSFSNGNSVTIRNIKKIFGEDPEKNEPCFYNQDWYNNESFIDEPMKEGWYLIRKEIYEDSRALQPENLLHSFKFPTAVCCVYSFFVLWFAKNKRVWLHDFVWCSDLDHNGDRIYVGKYNDEEGINKNGFSIHRHLRIRRCYGSVDWE